MDAGTYIRTLCEDMGKVCGGARMEELRRIAVGRIGEDKAHTMQELSDAMSLYRKGEPVMLEGIIEPPEKFIDLPRAFIKESALASVLSGAQIMGPGVERIDEGVSAGDRVAVYCGELFVGVGLIMSAIMEAKHGSVIKMERTQARP